MGAIVDIEKVMVAKKKAEKEITDSVREIISAFEKESGLDDPVVTLHMSDILSYKHPKERFVVFEARIKLDIFTE